MNTWSHLDYLTLHQKNNISIKAAITLHRMIAGVDGVNLTIMPNPLPAQGLKGHPRATTWRELSENDDGFELVQLFESYLGRIADTGTNVFRQPLITMASPFFSRAEFSEVSGDGSMDAVHMNAVYGSIVIAELIRQLR